MKYRTIVTNQDSIKKLLDTNRIPWEVALELAEFGRDIDRISADYNKAHNTIQFTYGKKAQAEDQEDMSFELREAMETEVQALLDKEIEGTFNVPIIDADVIKKLYAIKKSDDEESDEDIFTVVDIKAYKALGLI